MGVQQTLINPRELRGYRFGLILFLVTQAVPFVVLYAVEYYFDGFYISPAVNQWLGAVEVLLIILAWITGRTGLRAIRHDNLPGLIRCFRQSLVLSLANLVVLGYQWGTRFVPPGTRYGEVFYTVSGVTGFYTLVGIFVLFAISIRAGRVRFTSGNSWDAEATMYFVTFSLLTNVLTYLFLYWI